MVERESDKTPSCHLSRVQHVIRETHQVFVDHECAFRAAGLAWTFKTCLNWLITRSVFDSKQSSTYMQ